jgi:hypothetical protein
MAMCPYAVRCPDDAEKDILVLTITEHDKIPPGSYMFVDCYCDEADCDCRRVILHVVDAVGEKLLAGINYAFERPRAPHDDEPQLFLDPLNVQTELAPAFLKLFEDLISEEPAKRDRFVRRYGEFKLAGKDRPIRPSGGALPNGIRLPDRKISETIMDFAKPLLEQEFGRKPPPADKARPILGFAITVWNAHVLAMPAHGSPDILRKLERLAWSPDAPPQMRATLHMLGKRRREHFADDFRIVGDWGLEPKKKGEFTFWCDARVPDSYLDGPA